MDVTRQFEGQILASLRQGLIVCGADGRIRYWNASMEEVSGMGAGEVVGRSPAELLPFLKEDELLGWLGRAMAGEAVDSADFEYRFAASGRSGWAVTELLPFRGADEEVEGVVLVFDDITHRRREDRALRRSEANLTAAQQLAHLGSWELELVDVPGSERGALHWSSEVYRIFGYEPGTIEADTENFFRAVHPEDRERIRSAVRRAIATGGRYDLEHRILLPDGSERVVRERAEVMADARTGRPVRLVGTVHDVTELKAAQQALERREKQFRSLIENAQDLITIIDPRGRLRFLSPSSVAVLGYSPQQLFNQDAFAFIHPDDAPGIRAALERALTLPGRPQANQFRFHHSDGSWRTLEAIGRRLADEVEPLIVVNARDITERLQLEEQFRQAQKMEAVGQLAGGVAHDFNNILAAMIMQSELAASHDGLPEEVQDLLRDLKISAERAANLTRQLLAFSRRQVMQARTLDLNEVVTSLAKMLQRILGESVRMQLNLHPVPLHVQGDPGMLDQVLLNLAINARDAMPNGGRLMLETAGRSLTVEEARLLPETMPGSYACLRVSDTGCGIPPEVQQRIFEPFFTTKPPGKGTGLGLATVFGIIKQHQGAIRVQNNGGQGTSFEVLLPSVKQVAPQGEAVVEGPSPRGGRELILVVEDDPEVRRLTRATLERQGYRVLEAADGVEARQIWGRQPGGIHLLLTDLVMPEGVSGWELAEQLRRLQPGLKVIFTSGYSAELSGGHLHLGREQDFLQKPCPPRTLLEVVRKRLDA